MMALSCMSFVVVSIVSACHLEIFPNRRVSALISWCEPTTPAGVCSRMVGVVEGPEVFFLGEGIFYAAPCACD